MSGAGSSVGGFVGQSTPFLALGGVDEGCTGDARRRSDRPGGALSLLQPRWASSYLRGPMTSKELRRGR